MNITRNRVLAGLVIAAGAVAMIVFGTQSNAAVWNGKDCSGNSIIKCGVTSPADLRAKYRASSELQALYGHFGVTSAAINGTMYDGVVTKDGTITVNGKVVATGARSVGRYQDNGTGCKGTPFTVNGKTYYMGPTSCRFGYSAESAFVMLDANGNFIGAVIKGCGNIVYAKPVAKPVYTCNYITAEKISRTEYKFNVSTTAKNGAVNKDYVYNFGDGQSATVGAGGVKHTYAKPGTYTVSVTARFIVNGKVVSSTSAKCKTTVTVTPAPVVPQPVYACESLTAKGIQQADRSTLRFDFAAKASAKNGATIRDYTYNFGDGSSQTTGATASHTYAQSGTYTATVTANVVVAGKVVPTTSATCKVTVKPYKNVVKEGEAYCTGLELQKISVNTFNLKASAYATAGVPYVQNPGVIKGYTFTVKSDAGAMVKTVNVTSGEKAAQSGNFTLEPGKYTAQVVVHTGNGDSTKDACTVKIEVPTPAPNMIDVCRLSDYTIVSIKETEFDSSKYSKNLEDCKKVTVCDTTTGKIVTVTKGEAQNDKYSTDLSKCEKVEVCDTTTGKVVTVTAPEAKNDKYTTDMSQCEKVEVCDTTTGEKVTVLPSQIDNDRYTKDMSKCTPVAPVTPETPATPAPETPAELPHTGIADGISGLLGLGALAGAGSYYRASRRALKN